jgi:ketosteroid isomerase-like protein
MKRLLIVGLACAASVTACAASQPRAFTPADRAAVTGVLTAQQDAWNRGDLVAYMDGYLRSDALVFTSGSKIRRGWNETRAAYETRYGADRSGMGKLAFEIIDVQAVGADGAIILGRWILTETPNAGSGVFSVILERRPEGWRIVHDHTSSDPPP